MNNTTKSDFFTDVLDVARLIPKGRVTSYGAIAKYLGAPRSSRMVGWAMNKANNYVDVPAHRVVNRIGLLTGRAQFDPPELMQEKLEKEGVDIEKNKVIYFDELFWDPGIELDL